MTPLEAELYALTHRGHPGDVAFYAQACAGATSVLELGAGCGRVALGLIAPGRRVVGLEREAALLRLGRARAKRDGVFARSLRWVQGDMQDFALEQPFERIILPYSGLYCVAGRRGRERCFRRVREHLQPGGEFYFDVWSAEAFDREPSRGYRDDAEPVVSFTHRGQVWDVFERSRLQRARQRLEVTYHYVSRSAGLRVQSRICHAYATRAELEASLSSAGLKVARVWGDFSGARLRRTSELLVVRAVRRGA